MGVPKRLRFEIFKRDGNTCQYCGRSAPEVKLEPDHVVPEVLGGKTEPANLVTACSDCNAGKSATPPDAASVESVSQSALRWTAAMQAAAKTALSNLAVRDAQRDKFKEKWDSWTANGATMPLPTNWGDSVDRFLAAGLPMPILLDCIDKAMSTPKVKADGLFRYMCGIGWGRVTELQEAAQKIADGGEAAQVETADSFDAGRVDFARELLEDHLDEDARSELLKKTQAAHQAMGDGDPLGADELLLEAAYDSFGGLSWDLSGVTRALKDALKLLPAEDVAICRESTERETREMLGDEADEPMILRGLVTSLTEYTRFKSLPTEQRAEWAECFRVAHDLTADEVDLVEVAKYVARCEDRGYFALSGMCARPGKHDCMCTSLADYAVRVENCPNCTQAERETCGGHPMCADHAAEIVDGKCTSVLTSEPLIAIEITEMAVSA